jgi:hypothetical protein
MDIEDSFNQLVTGPIEIVGRLVDPTPHFFVKLVTSMQSTNQLQVRDHYGIFQMEILRGVKSLLTR